MPQNPMLRYAEKELNTHGRYLVHVVGSWITPQLIQGSES